MGAVIASLLATLQLLLGAIGSNVVLERSEPDGSPLGVVTGDTTCAEWVLEGRAWRCPDNIWRVRIAPAMDFAGLGIVDAASEIEAQRQAAALTTLVHELAHVYDAMDDGEFNGSRGHPRPDGFEEALHITGGRRPWEPSPWYCWAAGFDSQGTFQAPASERASAEWYACEVARTGRLQ
ncbi:MAG: hypothetical protein O2822_04940 [Chloroflexi bacterium]|nr:hypothetical protein [Chloroflexota bacterium]